MSDNPFDFSDFRGGASGSSGGSAPGSGARPLPVGAYQQPPRTGIPGSGVGVPSTDGEVAVARPPLGLLGISLALAVLGATLAALLGSTPWLAVVGWVLAGPAAFAALASFSSTDTRQRARSVYAAPSWLRAAYVTTAVVAVAAVVVTAVSIAQWVGRL